jgi:hypothetical protein
MAGTNWSLVIPNLPPGAADFRNAIHAVMTMAAPTGTDEQAVFHFPPAVVVHANHDGLGIPFDPSQARTATEPATVTTTCLVSFHNAGGQADTPFGVAKSTRVSIYLLDTEYAAVRGCSHVMIRGDRYDYSEEPPGVGLFDVTLHEMIFTAWNET